MIRKLVAGAVGALFAVGLLPAPPAGASGAAGPLDCTYRFIAYPGGFMADIFIVNSGPRVDGWTVRWTFRETATLTATWNATITQSSPYEMAATDAPWNRVINTGQAVAFGWSALAATADVPEVMTINGTPC
jgi:cellulose 1,4-beta-cellobiosidase